MENLSPREILQSHLDAGVDETLGDLPVDRFVEVPPPQAVAPQSSQQSAPGLSDGGAPAPAAPAAPAPPQRQSSRPAPMRPQADPTPAGNGAVKSAVERAEAATSLDELRAALSEFDGCPLSKTATHLVFGDGAADARVVIIGEAPGAEEDRHGVPFIGPGGKLLDKMLASIGLDRGDVFISNTVYWRPPGNRTPTPMEMAVCAPFVERMVELVDPDMLVTLGGPATKAMLAQSESVGKLRGKWFSYATPRMSRPVPATALYHPDYLLVTAAQKRNTWRDLLEIRRKLDAIADEAS